MHTPSLHLTLDQVHHQCPIRHQQWQHGFSLVEIMIVAAILGILSAIALPTYTSHVKQAQRKEAQAMLMANIQFMQRYYATNNRYSTAIGGTQGPTLPHTQAPEDGTISYNIGFVAGSVSDTQFTLQAVPQGSMASDKCGTFTLSSTGARGLIDAAASMADCWK